MRSLPCLLLTALLLAHADAAGAGTAPTAEHPDWSGQWHRVGSLNWPPEGYAEAGPPPLNDEYMARWERYRALQDSGIPAGDPPATCLPAGMPRLMKMSFPMEIVVTPAITYVIAEWNSDLRRVYTDGRDWPDWVPPAFNGYSIGAWRDTNDDGEYDTLTIETRHLKGPRSFDSTGVPLHDNAATVIHEVISLAEPGILENRITTYDDALTGPWTIHQRYRRQVDDIMWVEYACAEDQRHVVLGEDWYLIGADGTLQPTREGQPPLIPGPLPEVDGD